MKLDVSDYPFKSHFFTIAHFNNQDIKMHYLDEGEGEPLVLLHGNPTWSFYYRTVIQKFRSQFRMIAPDHIGSGFSDKPENYPYRLSDHIQNLSLLLNHLNITSDVTLVVHDWGGAIGFGWAVNNCAKVKRIIVLNTAAFWLPDVPKRIAMLRMPYLGEWIIRFLNGFAWPATWMAVTKRLSPTAKAGLLAPYDSWKNRIGIARFVQDIPLTFKHPTYHTLRSIEEKLPELACPKLIIWGMKDFCFHHSFLEKWLTIYPTAKLICLASAGHYVLEDASEEVVEAMNYFLTGHG